MKKNVAAVCFLFVFCVTAAFSFPSLLQAKELEPAKDDAVKAEASTQLLTIQAGSFAAGGFSAHIREIAIAVADAIKTASMSVKADADVQAAEPAEEYTPPLSGLKIGIDAGHQSKGNSALEPVAPGSSEKKAKVSSGTRGVSSGVYEYEVNLRVALLLEQLLSENGAEVVMVRNTNDVDISNVQRATLMNDEDVDLCIRIHANGSENRGIKGALMLVPSSRHCADIAAESREAGEIIFERFLEATGAANTGITERSDLSGFNWSEVPVCLIELGYMTNPDEDRLLVSPEHQAKCAKGLYDGILEWYIKTKE